MTTDVSATSVAVPLIVPDLSVTTQAAYAVILPGTRLVVTSHSTYVVLLRDASLKRRRLLSVVS